MLSETDNEGFVMKTAINAYRYPSICVVSGSSETSESSDEIRSPLETSQVSSLSPIAHGKRVQMLQQQEEALQDEPRVSQIRNAFQAVVIHPTRLRSFSIDENANEKQLPQVDSLNNEIQQAGMNNDLEQLDQLELKFSSLPPTLHIGQAQILRLDTESSQQQTDNAIKTQASYQRLYRPASLLSRKYAEREWLTDGPISLPLELASNNVSLRIRESSAIASPTRGILSRNSEILSQSSPTDTETKSLSESPVDNSPLGIPLPPPLSYHPSILDEGSVREPSVAQSPAKSLEDTSACQPTKYSTLSLGRNARVADMMILTTSATMPRSFKPTGSEEAVNSPISESNSIIPKALMRAQTEPPNTYAASVQDSQGYHRTNSVEACGAGSESVVMVRPSSAASERSMAEGRDTPLNHFSPIASSQLSAPGPVVHPIAVNPIQGHNTVYNPRSRSGIVDLELNLESCYIPPPQPEMPTPPTRPSRPSSLYDDKVYATFLPGPHTPVATYIPNKQYAPQSNTSSVPSNYAAPFDLQPLSGVLQMRKFSPNDNSLPLCSSDAPGGIAAISSRSQYVSNATFQAPRPLLFERLSYSRPYGYSATTHLTRASNLDAPAEAVMTVAANPATRRDELVWSNPNANCCVLPMRVSPHVAPPAGLNETYSQNYHANSSGDISAVQQQPATPELSNSNSAIYPRDRRSWSVQSENPPPLQRDARRASLASDRLGPCKPTSLTDFKRLLIQTRSQTNPAGERRSATELLKIAKTNPAPATSSAISTSSLSGTSSTPGSVKRPTGMKFSSGIEPIQEEGESVRNSSTKLSII
ncbi:hypothetical protein BIW11_10159 [Tropilaelaps mercedesae]|uniref:Uncharacterized protein n=1 Tax=Tropilaelaps mercedesae TaxID=418985 RepID=A0A1V9XHC8_9ACAR|nr:hypothetical protein BIW11_10159 [Tropilaelaps mercedesae]